MHGCCAAPERARLPPVPPPHGCRRLFRRPTAAVACSAAPRLPPPVPPPHGCRRLFRRPTAAVACSAAPRLPPPVPPPHGCRRLPSRAPEPAHAAPLAAAGKCANRLAAPMGVPAVYGQLRRLKLSANWVLMVAFAAPVATPGGLEGAVVQDCEVLSWAANNSRKLRLGGPAECWTLISTQAYGRQNKVPQVSEGCATCRQVQSALSSSESLCAAWPPACAAPCAGHHRHRHRHRLPPRRRMCRPRWRSA